MKTIFKTVFVFCSTAVVAGCGASGTRDVSSPSQRVAAPVALRLFESPGPQTLQNNKIFLWPVGVSAADTSLVLRMAQQIDSIDTQYYLADQELNRAKVDPRFQVVEQIRARHVRAWQERSRTAIPVNRAVRTRDSARNELQRARETGDEQEVARCERKLAEAQARLDQLDMGPHNRALQQEAQARAALDEALVVHKEPLDAVTVADGRLKNLTAEGSRATTDLLRVVELDEDGPTSVNFDVRPDGSLYVYIANWAVGNFKSRNLSMPPRTFSTEDGSITNASYVALGGRIQFDVAVYNDDARTDLQARYNFKLARNEYAKTDDPADGRIFYVGEVWREYSKVGPLCSEQEAAKSNCRRIGSAKFVSIFKI